MLPTPYIFNKFIVLLRGLTPKEKCLFKKGLFTSVQVKFDRVWLDILYAIFNKKATIMYDS